MHPTLRPCLWLLSGLLALPSLAQPLSGPLRDGGIDPANLGKGEWLYYMSSATNNLGGYVSSVTNEDSLMGYMKSQGIRYVMVKAATSNFLFKGSYSFPQFTSNLVNAAHANGLWIFGYNRSSGGDIAGEVAISDYVFQQGADGFVWDAEAEWESSRPWIGTNGPAKAWQLCSMVRSNWPNKFLAHSPFPIISYHSSFPYKEFGYWCDTVMPQIYHFSTAGIEGSVSAGINWSDANWASWQDSLVGQASVIEGHTIYWTNAIKPIVPIQDVYAEPFSPAHPATDVQEFIDYLAADPNAQTVGGYKGANFFRADLHGAEQWANIKSGSLGSFGGLINNLVFDDNRGVQSGTWKMVRTFASTPGTPSFSGNGSKLDNNSFGTNYWVGAHGQGSNWVQFNLDIQVPGDYELYQWHPTVTNASAGVTFQVNCYTGLASPLVNQQTNNGTWSWVGRFYFDVGGSNWVRVTDLTLEPNSAAVVDGLKLVYALPSSKPNMPSRLGAAPFNHARIDLSWADTANNETGFIIAGSTNLAGPYSDRGSVSANVHTFSSTGLVANTTYFFTVRSTNFLGASAPSAPASASTPAYTPVRSWGDGSWGQLFAPLAATEALDIAAGAYHSLALSSSGQVVAWGNNFEGQCDVPAALQGVLAIAAGGYHSLALKADGSVIAWGDNSAGQTNVPWGLKQVLGLAAGTWHSLALKRDGTVRAWGDNSSGQTNVPAGLSNVVAIAAGGSHSLALKADGSVVAWGDNSGPLGSFAGQSVVPPGLGGVQAIAAGAFHSLALRSNGTVLAWGDNSLEQCNVPAGLSNVVAVAAGGAHSLALSQAGSLTAWGANGDGQCNLPSGLSNVVALAAGEALSLALAPDGLPALRLLSPSWSNGRFSLLLRTFSRSQYVLESAAGLGQTNWTVLSTNRGSGALRQLSEPAGALSRQFYRVRQF